MRFVRARADEGERYDHVVVLSVHEARSEAAELVRELQGYCDTVEVRSTSLPDPSDYEGVFGATRELVHGLGAEIDVVLSAGTPQMQTVWLLLVKAGFLDARLFQVIPPAFVPDPHPKATREVRLDFEGFPEIMALREEVARLRRTETSAILGHSPAIQELRERVTRVAASEIPVLVIGETGTGKELVARSIHEQSTRNTQPFIAENCGALSESVLESELFGHEAGAFTGARDRRRGLFERADGGTLFLDEVGELSARSQSSLLRVLQEGRLRRVGGEHEVAVDVRVVAATHRDLRALVREGRFREDLYYRLAGVTLHVPALRERIEDLGLLVDAFSDDDGPALTGSALRVLRTHRWPGNVRELQAEVRRWQVFCDRHVRVADLSAEVRGLSTIDAQEGAEPATLVTLGDAVAAIERETIELALARTGWNLSQSARELAIDRNTLKRKIRGFALTRDS